MNTKIFTKNELSEAAAMIRNGGIVVMPTETVYGLAANAFDAEAVEKIFAAKGRQADNPLIVHIANNSDWEKLVEDIPQKARQLADRFWPGPLTIILKKKPIVPDIVSGGLDTVAVRMPKNKIAFRFIRECGCPLAAPSANLSGCPSPTKFSHVMKDMNGRVDGIIEGSDCMVGLESTVISLAGDKPIILRPGRITAAQIAKVIGDVEIHHAVTGDLEDGEEAASPGMKYKHYAPNATVTIVDGDDEEYINFIKENADDDTAVICFTEMADALSDYHIFPLGAREDSVAQSKKLFDVLRAVDDAALTKAYAPMPSREGVGLAVNNRLLRAAGFNVIKQGEETEPDGEDFVNAEIQAAETLEKNEETAEEIPAELAEEMPKEEKPSITTKKAVKDKKPDARPKHEPEKKASAEDDDAVQVIGLGENEDSIINPDFIVAEAKPLEETDEEKELAEESAPKQKKGKKHRQKKKKQKREAQREENAEEQSEVVSEDIPDFEVNTNSEELNFDLLDEKLEKEESAANDLTLSSLNELTLSEDFNDDFSKEISENIIVIDPDEEKNPLKKISDVILNKEGATESAADAEDITENEVQQAVEKPKKGFFKSLFVKRSSKANKQVSEPEIVQEVSEPVSEKEEKKENKPEKQNEAQTKKEVPEKEEPKKENNDETKSKKEIKDSPKKKKTKIQLPKKEQSNEKKSSKKETSAKAEPLKDFPKDKEKKKDIPLKSEPEKEETKFQGVKKPEPVSADKNSAGSLSKNWKYNPEKNKKDSYPKVKEESFKSTLAADEVNFEAISYEKFNKPLTDSEEKKGGKKQKPKVNDLSVQLIKQEQQSTLPETETIAHELNEKDVLGIKLDVKEEKPESILKEDANIEDTVGKIQKVEGIKVIGVTGKTGAGKGVVTKNLAQNKTDTAFIDADKLYHALLEKENMEVSIVFAFGQSVVGDNGGIDRKKLAAVAFSSEENIRKLNRATHPYVAKEIVALIEDSKKKGMKTIYLDAPTLIESGLYRICDEIIFVKSPKDVRKKRIMERDNLSDEQAEQRMRLEKNDKFYLKYANKVIEN